MLKKCFVNLVAAAACFFPLDSVTFEQVNELKGTIALLEKKIKQNDSGNGAHEKELAQAYLRDQDLEKAFKTYLSALDSAQITPSNTSMGKGEQALYNEALKIYLNPRQSPHESALTIKEMYASTIKSHQDYYHLAFLVALAYANLSEFDRFFDLFYASYLRLPDHYLAYKAKAILHSRLLDRVKTPEEKEKERKAVLENLQRAKEQNPKDLSLYKMQIIFSSDKDKDEAFKQNVREILDANLVIPRVDLPFYFDGLLAYGQLDLAKEFLKRARSWYPYSRTLDSAQDLINRKLSSH